MPAVADTTTGAKVKVYNVSGPASYATGGFLLDASADFSWIGYVDVQITAPGVLGPIQTEFLLNRDLSSVEAYGKATLKLVRGRYDKATMGAPAGNPAGTAVQAALFAAATTTGSSHTHTIDHDHPSVTSATETAAGTLGVNLAAGGGNMVGHTHNFDVPAFTGSSAAATHAHNRSFEYDHSHNKTEAAANISAIEVANGTNISTTTFAVLVYGFGKA